MKNVTPRRLELLRYIAGHLEAYECAPSLQEMSDAIGNRFSSTTLAMLHSMKSDGLIIWPQPEVSSIRILTVPIPRAPDGAPLHAVPLDIAS